MGQFPSVIHFEVGVIHMDSGVILAHFDMSEAFLMKDWFAKVDKIANASNLYCQAPPSGNTQKEGEVKQLITNTKKNPPESDFPAQNYFPLKWYISLLISCPFRADMRVCMLPTLPIWNSRQQRRPHVNTLSSSSWRQIAPLLLSRQAPTLGFKWGVGSSLKWAAAPSNSKPGVEI